MAKNLVQQRLLRHSTNSDEQQHQVSSQFISGKSRLQLRAPPPLNTLSLLNFTKGPTSEDKNLTSSTLSAYSSVSGNGPSSSMWFGNSSALDSLLINPTPLVMSNNNRLHCDDDLPSLFAKQVR